MPHERLDTYFGLPVQQFYREHLEEDEPPAGSDEPGAYAWRLGDAYEDELDEDEDGYDFGKLLEGFAGAVDVGSVRALVIGWWGPGWEENTSEAAVKALAAMAGRMPELRAVFLGEMTSGDSEISWIEHGDVTPLLEAFPRLERLDVRGSSGLRLRPVRHEALRTLRFESGGLPGHVVRAVGECELPALEHLELWLGVANYGGDCSDEDLRGVLAGEGLPALRHLGLQDSERQDEIAALAAAAPVVARLESLSLSMGTLGDEGAEALLSGQPLTHLARLDLSNHYFSEGMAERLRAALPGVELTMTPGTTYDWNVGGRYVEVSE
ncbi:STM4015 family protein [Bailinhaonella thermotolerans]|uniref:Leucine-rich repeat domain-containing protein n=1 Tax=Bailinhaonella thermotolerans TaxID=1070861 RepID=A0A3A4ADX3_9ACTN|nr:STM4015 family protein [Bailinhaonella thermotolerans]RJL24250.1 leucine-rich repeat domain-containing protein [Bailinhaonella thermotolerans]